MTIPSIGSTNGGMILDEIGDIHRFSTPSKLLAVEGLDPSVKAYYDARRAEVGHITMTLALCQQTCQGHLKKAC